MVKFDFRKVKMTSDKGWTDKGQNVNHGYFGVVQVTI